MMYASDLIHGPMDVTSPPDFLQRSRKATPTIPGPHKIPTSQPYNPPSPIAPQALWSKLPASHRLHRPTTAPSAERIPDPPIQH
jgi:hypothetical protein